MSRGVPSPSSRDDLHDKRVHAIQVAGEQPGPAARVGVQRRQSLDAPGVPPLGNLTGPGPEHRHPLVFGIAHGKAPVRQHGNGLCLAELAGTLATAPKRFHKDTERIKHLDMLRLDVQDMDGPVVGNRNRSDAAEEILLGAVQLPDGDFGHERGLGAPDASRKGADDGRVTDGFDDGLGGGAGRVSVGSAGDEEGGGWQQGQGACSHGCTSSRAAGRAADNGTPVCG